jgi:anti-sigma factor RsiW
MAWFRRSAHPEEELSAYVDGELGERARRAVERHLAGCEACSTLLEELQDTKALVRELPRPVLRRSLTLGPEFAAEPRPEPAPRRSPFVFAPAVALTVLVALLFVDAIDTTGGSQQSDAGFSSAGSTASRAAEPEAGGGQALESANAAADEETAPGAADTATGGDEEAPREPADASSQAAAGAEPEDTSPTGGGVASADSAGPSVAAEAVATPEAALAPPSQDAAPEPELTPEERPLAAEAAESDGDDTAEEAAPGEVAPQPQVTADEDAAEAVVGEPAEAPQDASPQIEADDSSGGPSTLRILEIAAAVAFGLSLAAVFLPRIVGRSER